MRLALLAAVPLAVAAGFGIKHDRERQDAKPPFWDNPCVHSRTENGLTIIPAPIGIPIGGGLSMLPMSNDVCERRVWVCNLGGKNYKGERVCPPKPPGEPAP